MSLFCLDYENSNVFYMPYEYKPFSLLVNSIYEIKKNAGIEYQVNSILAKCMFLVNKFISAREVNGSDIDNIREIIRRGLSRSDLKENAKIIYKCFKYIDQSYIIGNSLENLILSQYFSKYGLLIDESQWKYIYLILKDRDLIDFIQPIFKKELREKYFDIPIISFLPVAWVSELIILPPTENLFFIYPDFISNQMYSRVFFKAPDNSSIEIQGNKIKFIENESFKIQACVEFNEKFSNSENIEIEENNSVKNVFEDIDLFENERFFSFFEVKNSSGDICFIECSKEYLTITLDGVIRLSTFENQDQLYNTKYIIKDIDTSSLTSENLKRAKNSIMEKWKKPLRNYPNLEALELKLTSLGAIKATIPNIKNWYSPDNIAPRSFEDYKAVLLFAGISDKEEIERFFELAKKLRGDSISEGHEKKVIGQEIVIDFLNKIKASENLKSSYEVEGINFSIIKLG
ncbi:MULTISPECIES: hypothetical protein [unclassified Acinetobacter]|uniref:hypothetical protein n=1 Tax=unclassified Acinetobacter TaxID=196816 RepID=UPI0015D2F0A8|nr:MULTISPECIES: hypothetical protein [unclassified Acinetobacter]